MFFVDDDQAEPWQGGEHREAGSEDDVGVTAQGLHEAARAGAIGLGGMKTDDARVGEARLYALLELGRERDLGHEHQSLLAVGERVGDEIEVDLGLAAAGDTMQQPGLEARGGSTNHRQYRLLLVGERRRSAAALAVFETVGGDPAALQRSRDRRRGWQGRA